MFCPRCGRQLSDTANFCGGCGLSKAEIERYTAAKQAPAEEVKAEATVADIVTDADFAAQPAQPQPAETATEPAAEAETAQPAEPETEPAAEPQPAYKAPEASYHYSYVNSTQPKTNYTAQPAQQTVSAPSAKNENLSTVDFIWMLIISSIPVVGLVYLVYLAIQDNNTNKRSYARATLIIAAFAVVISLVFAIGFLISGVM